MKTFKLTSAIVFFLSTVLTSFTTQAQDIQFADVHLKTVLISDQTINLNGDAEIQKNEAMSFTGSLNLDGKGIHDLSGIEYFTQLRSLIISNNQLTDIDLSNNVSLERLICNNNKIYTLELSNLTELKELNCNQNNLTELNLLNNNLLVSLKCADNKIANLDLYNNLDLENLNCTNNEISTLDVSENTELVVLYCAGNQMTGLNIANNNNLNITTKNIDISGNALNCIQVDDEDHSNQYWTTKKDANAYFSVDCNSISSPSNTTTSSEVSVYPNPSNGVLNIDMGGMEDDVEVNVINNVGSTVATQKFEELDFVTLNLELNAGMYIVNVSSKSGKQKAVKLIVQ